MKEILFRTITAHAEALTCGEYTSELLVRAFLERICERNAAINAYLFVDEQGAIEAARASDERRKNGACLGVLDGIPYALKDNIAAKGLQMTCGSRILEGYISPYDATVTERLRASGAVLLGKTNMDEFAMGSSGE